MILRVVIQGFDELSTLLIRWFYVLLEDEVPHQGETDQLEIFAGKQEVRELQFLADLLLGKQVEIQLGPLG